MAVNQGLNVQLSADASQFIATLQAALAQAQAAASGMANTAASMSALANAANTATAAAASLNNSLNSTTQAGNSAGSSAQNLASTLNFVQQGASRLGVSIQNFNNSLLSTSPVMRGFINDARNGQLSFVGLNGAVSQAGNAITGVNRIIQSVNNSLVALNRNALSNSAVMRGFANSARLGQISYVGLNGALTNAGRAIPSTTTSLNRFGNSTNRTGLIAMNFGRVLSDLPFGFIAIQNNITPLLESLGIGAGLGLAFTIAGAAATTLVQKYGSLSNAISQLNPFLTAQQKAQASVNAAMAAAANSSLGDISRVQLLMAATKDLNIPLSERKKIVDDLIKQYPQTLKGATAEKAAVGELDEKYQQLVKTLTAKAVIQAGTDAISKQGKALLDLRLEATQLDKELKDIQQNSSKPSLSNPFGADPIKAARQISAIQNSINVNKRKEKDINDQIAAIQAEQLKLAEQFGAVSLGVDEQTDKKGRKVKTVTDILKQLNAELANIDAQAKLTNASFDSISDDKVAALQKAFKGLIELGLKPTSPEIQKIASQIELFSAATIGTVPIATKNIQALGKAFKEIKTPNLTVAGLQDILNVKDRSSQLQLSPTVKIAPVLKTTAALENVDKFQAQMNARLDKARKDTQAKVDKSTIVWGNITSGLGAVTIDLSAQLSGLASAASVGLGEVIGGIISGGDSLGKSLYKLVGVMGQFIEDFGKSLIEAATLKIIAEKTLFSNPYIALAAGVAAVAIGSVLKNKTPSFATGGGVVGGPQLAMIGDNPGREEYVIPSEVLDRLGGGGPRIVRVVGILRGQDIAFANQRATRAKSRIN